MENKEGSLEARIPVAAINNFEAVHQQMREIRSRKLSPEEQSEAFQQLLESSTLKGGDQTLFAEAISQATRPEDQEPTDIEEKYKKASQKAGEVVRRRVTDPEFSSLVVKVDNSGNINTFIQKIYPREDEKRARRSADRIGWGPKQNDASGRITPSRIPVSEKTR